MNNLEFTGQERSGLTQLNTLDPGLLSCLTWASKLPQISDPLHLIEIKYLERLVETSYRSSSHPSRSRYRVSASFSVLGAVYNNSDYGDHGRLCAEAQIAVEIMHVKGELPNLFLVSGQELESSEVIYQAPCPCGMCRSNLFAVVHGTHKKKDPLRIIAVHEWGEDIHTFNLSNLLPYNFQTCLNAPDQATPYSNQEFLNTSRKNISTVDCRRFFDERQIFRMGGDEAFTTQMQASLLITLDRLNANSSVCTCLYADGKYQTFSGLKVMLGTDTFHLSAEMVAVILSVVQDQKPEAIIVAGHPIGDYFYSPLGNASQFLLDLQQSLDWSLPIVLVWQEGDQLGLVRTEAARLVPHLDGLVDRGYLSLYKQSKDNSTNNSRLRFSSANLICLPLITRLREIYSNQEPGVQLENYSVTPQSENPQVLDNDHVLDGCNCGRCRFMLGLKPVPSLQYSNLQPSELSYIEIDAITSAVSAMPSPNSEPGVPLLGVFAGTLSNLGANEPEWAWSRREISVRSPAPDCVLPNGLQIVLSQLISNREISPTHIVIAISKDTCLGPYSSEFLNDYLQQFKLKKSEPPQVLLVEVAGAIEGERRWTPVSYQRIRYQPPV